ncbi:hypothetical protein ES703_78307 [subsurface metagenome]
MISCSKLKASFVSIDSSSGFKVVKLLIFNQFNTDFESSLIAQASTFVEYVNTLNDLTPSVGGKTKEGHIIKRGFWQ